MRSVTQSAVSSSQQPRPTFSLTSTHTTMEPTESFLTCVKLSKVLAKMLAFGYLRAIAAQSAAYLQRQAHG